MKVVADEPVVGVADRVAAVADLGDDAPDRLLESLATDGLSLPAERGLPGIARRVIDRLRGARPVEELGEVDAAFEILGLHVPPAGRAALHLARSESGDRQVSIKAIGSGFGGGRTLTLAVDEDIPERNRCMVIRQHVTLAVRRFERDAAGQPWIRTDVVAWSNREFVGLDPCVHCGASGDDLDPLEFDEDEAGALDLRSYDAAVTRKSAMTLAGKRKADIGVDVGGKAGAGFHLEQQTTISCTASYTFPAGRWFLPYRPAGDTAALPYWAVR
ncbi:hypothetical protein ACQP2F_22940 [Actinoplanes sp. CA-030573]|uniref:hypothetical protein n=1 Tax=Actinoplanes sp. CA-030573 TaxID=3239898 RepID=UPI003D940830